MYTRLLQYTLLMSVVLASFTAHGACKARNVVLQVLGSGGPELNDGRASTGYLLWHENRAKVLIDAGSGTSLAFGKAKANVNDVEAILLSHLHVDHVNDLPAYIKGSYFTGRTMPMRILGPAGNALMPATSVYISRLLGESSTYPYLKEYILSGTDSDYKITTQDIGLNTRNPVSFAINDAIKVRGIGVDHGPVAALGWRVDIGACSISFSGDTTNKTDGFARLAKGSDIVVMHNAIPEEASKEAKALHMTPTEIGRLARDIGTPHIVISHRMNRTNGIELETTKAIRQHYSGSISFAEDMSVFRVGHIEAEKL
ncbi:MBL fold metallo-hydrolase [Aestuariibacter sp. AA17]|uniref:MBL fold metallo-hydrolase n=1 Tax=Fluctibacter corallii TaxID=2984329 RepID=A0ABT3ACQ3_9ALTE|nr:MBL fold metallo-hydrolase [Aestuariibacter sp. AA17]MCV2886452.1 MBL fold metallo-hydrolase [Aestuariibacter sp. AA17]